MSDIIFNIGQPCIVLLVKPLTNQNNRKDKNENRQSRKKIKSRKKSNCLITFDFPNYSNFPVEI